MTQNAKKCQKSKHGTDRPTDRQTDRRTDEVTYRVALHATKNEFQDDGEEIQFSNFCLRHRKDSRPAWALE